MSPPANELVRGSVWNFRYLDTDHARPVVIISNDGRNRSRFEWVHVVRITRRPKRPLPTIVELRDADAPSPTTMRDIDQALRRMLALG